MALTILCLTFAVGLMLGMPVVVAIGLTSIATVM